MSSNIKNKVKKKNKSVDLSKLGTGFGWWALISTIIISYISLTADNNIIKFLYPKNINEINITSKLLKDNSSLINLIKEINFFSISECKQEETSNTYNAQGGASSSIKGVENVIQVKGKENKGLGNKGLGWLFKIIKFIFVGGMDTEYFMKYLQDYNCKLIRYTLKFQNKYINSFLEEVNDLFKVNDNDKNLIKKTIFIIWNFIQPIIVFILKPIIVFILGYLKFIWKIIVLTFEKGGYGFTGKLIFSFINGVIMNIFVLIMFIIQILIHIFTFTLLPLFIIKPDNNNHPINIFENKFVPFIILLLLFLIPFFIDLIPFIIDLIGLKF